VSGCATNQVQFHADFDTIILLSAPREVDTGPPLDSVVATIMDIARAESHGADAQ
jgi:hypothetical protein